MPGKYSIRKYTDGDETGILMLFDEEFEGSRDVRMWNWKYKENSAGMAHIWLAVDTKEKIIGNLSLNPARIHMHDRVFFGGQAEDVVVKKEYRSLGKHRIVVELAERATRDALEKKSFDFYFGYPNRLFLRLTIKMLGYTKVSRIYQMTRPLKFSSFFSDSLSGRILLLPARIMDRIIHLFSLRDRPGKNRGTIVCRVSQFDEGADQLWREFESFYQPVGIVRDQHYLNWRYARFQGADYAKFVAFLEGRVVGFIVCRVREEDHRKRGYICDILVAPEMEKRMIPSLLKQAIRYCDSEGADSITCWAMSHMPLFQHLKKRGFVARPSEIHLVARILSEDVARENLFDPHNWYVSMGDSDGI